MVLSVRLVLLGFITTVCQGHGAGASRDDNETVTIVTLEDSDKDTRGRHRVPTIRTCVRLPITPITRRFKHTGLAGSAGGNGSLAGVTRGYRPAIACFERATVSGAAGTRAAVRTRVRVSRRERKVKGWQRNSQG